MSENSRFEAPDPNMESQRRERMDPREAEAARRLARVFAEARTPGAPAAVRSLVEGIREQGDEGVPAGLRALGRGRQRGRPTLELLGLAATVTLVVALGAMAVWIRNGAGPGATPTIAPTRTNAAVVPSTSSPTPVVATPAPTSTALPVAVGLRWQRLTLPEGVTFLSVTHAAQGFLAAGLAPGSMQPSLWRSPDAFSWQEVPLRPAAAFTTDANHRPIVERLAVNGSTIVAVGMNQYLDGSSADPAIWVSTDSGATWHAGIGSGSTDGSVEDVTYGPRGWVAVGSDGYTFHAGFPTRGAAVWTSQDGERWTRVAAQGSFAHARMGRVIAAGPGYVASGSAFATDASVASTNQALWVSADGNTWSRPALPGADAGANVAVVKGQSLVAFGAGWGATSSGVWTSTDGRSWRKQAAVAGTGFVALPMADGLVLAATGQTGDGTTSVTLQASSDLVHWSAAGALDLFANATVADGCATSDRVVLVGSEWDAQSATPPLGYVWVGTPAR